MTVSGDRGERKPARMDDFWILAIGRVNGRGVLLQSASHTQAESQQA